MIGRHLGYLRYLIRHKYYVMVECRRLDVPLWNALIHDWDKFMPGQWLPNVQAGYGTGQFAPTPASTQASQQHQQRRKHHYQYWTRTNESGEMECLPMPDVYRREMLADWRGAGLALGYPDLLAWYTGARDTIMLHSETRQWIEAQLGFRNNSE